MTGVSSASVYDESSSGGQVYVSYDGVIDTIIVAFRGSSNIENWLENLSISKVKYE